MTFAATTPESTSLPLASDDRRLPLVKDPEVCERTPLFPVRPVIAVVRILFAAIDPDPVNPNEAPDPTSIAAVVLVPEVIWVNVGVDGPPEQVPAPQSTPFHTIQFPGTAPACTIWAGLTIADVPISPCGGNSTLTSVTVLPCGTYQRLV